jgi:hypothetical protein
MISDELERIWKEAIVTSLKYCFGICLEGQRKMTNGSSRVAHIPAVIGTEKPLNFDEPVPYGRKLISKNV